MIFPQIIIDVIDLDQRTAEIIIPIIKFYGTIEGGDIYFDSHLSSESWFDSTIEEKRKALSQATQLIDKLSFSGSKFEEDQELEFPRDGEIVPEAINRACYETAIMLLDGVDINKEISNLAMNSPGFSSARTTYDRSFVLEHLRAGIPSALSWDLLKPYLVCSLRVNLSRVD